MPPVDAEMALVDASSSKGKKQPEKSYVKKETARRKRDFSEDLKVEIPAASETAAAGMLTEAVTRLLALEKKARLAGDIKSVVEVAVVIIKLCKTHDNWTELSANIHLLCKRRQQFKQVQEKVVQEAAEYVDETPDDPTRLALITTLRAVSEGQIFVEVERARLTYKLAQMEESSGDIDKAAATLQEEQVESYGGMGKREKLHYILEQVRLVLKKQDFVRGKIIANKVDKKAMEDPELEDLKIKYFELLITYHTHERDALELAKAHLAIYRCDSVKDDEPAWKKQLKLSALYLALAPFDNHQIDLVRILTQDKRLKEGLPSYYALLKHFISGEIAPWPLPENDELSKHPLMVTTGMDTSSSPSAANKDWYEVLHDRVMENDIRVVAGYYSRIKTARLAEFLKLSTDKAEEYVADMVTSGTIPLEAKIDRPSGIVVFAPKKDANAVLSEWSDDISELLGLVEKTCHLIHKENMMHTAKTKAA